MYKDDAMSNSITIYNMDEDEEDIADDVSNNFFFLFFY